MTDTTKADGPILKTDALGRVQTPAARREGLLDEFEGSGLSGQQFAALTGLKYQTFATWLQKRRRQGKAPVKPADTVRWLETVVEQAQSAEGPHRPALVLELPGGATVAIRDEQQAALVALLLRALESPCGRPSC